jgi:hypothetical protein
MSTRSALAGAAATAIVVGVLGSPAAQDAAADSTSPLLTRTVTTFPSWDVPDGASASLVWGIVLRLAVLLVGVLGLCAVAGRSQRRGPAFLAGWGALVVAASVAAAAGYVYTVAVVLEGGTLGDITGDGVVGAVNAGVVFGAWTGCLVGLAVAVATRPEPADVFEADLLAADATAQYAVAGGSRRRIADPPAPWWAPTAIAGEEVRPGPTVFPPGGMPPVVAGVEPGEPLPVPAPAPSPAPDPNATRELTTASGDPHPSDPDATQAVGIPPAGEDPDATTAIPEAVPDPTREMPRRTD